jgi:predicted dehydrogenase
MAGLALVGVGKWGANFLRTLALSELDDLVVIVSSKSQEQLAFIAKSSATVLPNLALLKNHAHEIDGIVVATPPDVRPAIVEQCLLLGIPVLAEKPLAPDENASAGLLSLAKSLNVLLLEDFIHLYSWPYLKLLEQIDDSRPITIESSGAGNGPFRDYSPIADYGSHDVAMALQLFSRLPIHTSLEIWDVEGPLAFTAKIKLDFAELGQADIIVSNVSKVKVRTFRVSQNNDSWIYDDTCQDKLVRNNVPQDSALQDYSSMQLVLDQFCGRRVFYESDNQLWLSGAVAQVLQDLEEKCRILLGSPKVNLPPINGKVT